MRMVVVGLTLFAGAAQGFAGNPDGAKLRDALPLPSVTIRYGLSVQCSSLGQWFVKSSDEREWLDKIAKLQQSLRGNAEDAEVHRRLGDLYEDVGQKDKAKASYLEAVRLYRKLIEARPKEPALLAGLGWALDRAGEQRSAEKVLRKATQLAPHEWLGWAALAPILGNRATEVLGQGSSLHVNFKSRTAETTLLEQLRSHPPSPETIRRTVELLAESLKCSNKAVEAAPRRPEPYVLRGMNRTGLNLIGRALRSLPGEVPQALTEDPVEAFLNDARLAANYSPQDAAAVAGPVVSSRSQEEECLEP